MPAKDGMVAMISDPEMEPVEVRVHPGKGTYRDIGFTGGVFRKRGNEQHAFSGRF